MKKNLIVFAGLLFLSVFLPTGTALGVTVYVPDDYPTIQAAVDAASSGDTIIVRDGNYTENVFVLWAHELTIESENGAETTIVQAADPDSDVFQMYWGGYVTISGFTIKGATGNAGIIILGDYNIIANNVIFSNYEGVFSLGDNNTIQDNNIFSNKHEGLVIQSFGNTIVGNIADGISIRNEGNFVEGNTVNGTISLVSDNNTIASNTINDGGIDLHFGTSNTITSNSVNNGGITLSRANNNVLTGNSANDGRIGITSDSNYNTINNNTINSMTISSSSNNQIASNTVWYSIHISGTEKSHFDNLIDTTNTVNGKPVYCYFDESNKVLEGLDTAHLTMAYCSDFKVINSNISNGNGVHLYSSDNNIFSGNDISSNNMDGINLYNSHGNKISQNNLSNNINGINLYNSRSNDISNNNLSFNEDASIWLCSSDCNNITDNTVSKNEDGIRLSSYSDDNIITGNNILSNNHIGLYLWHSSYNVIASNNISLNAYFGIYLIDSSSNSIYHNNLIDNTQNTGDYEEYHYVNFWDNGSEGNYWSDYTGVDADQDDIGDTPYEIPGDADSRDNYPLMNPYELYNSCDWDIDRDVDGSDLAFFADAYALGSPEADLNNNGSVDADDVAVFAAEFGMAKYPILEFMEDFEDGVPDNWVDDGSGVWSVENGVYKMIGNSPAENMVRFSYYDGNFSDFIYQVVVKWTQGNLDSLHGMYFRGDGTLQNRYAFVIQSNGYYLVGKVVDGTPILLIPLTYSGAIKQGYDAWNTLKVICSGSTISFYINDMFVDCIVDSEFSGGKVGVQDAEVPDTNNITHFDNVELFTLPDGL